MIKFNLSVRRENFALVGRNGINEQKFLKTHLNSREGRNFKQGIVAHNGMGDPVITACDQEGARRPLARDLIEGVTDLQGKVGQKHPKVCHGNMCTPTDKNFF